MRTPIVFFAIFSLLALSCLNNQRSIPEPDFSPYVLRPDRYIPGVGKKVSLDTLPPRQFKPFKEVPVDYFDTEGKKTPEKSNVLPVNEPRRFIAHREVINMDSVSPPRVIPGKGIKIPAPWLTTQPGHLNFDENSRFAFSYLDEGGGLASSEVRQVLEDRFGRIWMSHNQGEGISVWDGKEFIYHSQSGGLSGRFIRDFEEDKEGNIWFVLWEGGLSKWDGKEFTYYRLEDHIGPNFNFVFDLMVDSQGRIWIAGYKGVAVFIPHADGEGGEFKFYSPGSGLKMPRDDVNSVFEDQQGRICFGISGGLTVLEPDANEGKGQFFHYSFELAGFDELPGMKMAITRSWIEDPSGNIWAITGSGLVVWHPGEEGEDEVFEVYTEIKGNRHIDSMLKDRNGRIWMATPKGICIWDPNRKGFSRYGQEEGLKGQRLGGMIEDQFGRIWIATLDGGMNILRDAGFTHFSDDEGFKGLIWGLGMDSQGKIWISSSSSWGRGISTWESKTRGSPGTFVHHGAVGENWVRNSISGFSTDPRGGKLMIGFPGVIRWNGNQISRFTQIERIWDHVKDPAGRFWFATNNGGGVKVWEPNHAENASGFTLLDPEGRNHIAKDQQGNMWVATTMGLNVWEAAENRLPDTYTTYRLSEEETPHWYIPAFADREGKVWIGSRGEGLFVWEPNETRDGGQFAHYPGFDKFVEPIFQDATGVIWLGGEGLHRLIWSEKEQGYLKQSFAKADGLVKNKVSNLVMDNHNQLWIATGKGLSRLDLNTWQSDTTRPLVTLMDLQVFYDETNWREVKDSIQVGKEVRLREPALALNDISFDSVFRFTNLPVDPTFPYYLNQLTFRWSGAHGADHQLKYSYILEGKDVAWSPPISDNKIIFQGLDAGSYIFKVKAIGANQRWSETASYTFTISPPWWLSPAAKVVYALLAIGLLYGLYHWRTQKQREKLVLREKELVQEKQLTDQLQRVDQLKDQFLANTSHELRTPLHGIIGLAESVFEEVEEEGQKENLGMLIASGKRLSSLVNDLLDFSKVKNHDLTLSPKPLDLRPVVDVVLQACFSLLGTRPIQLRNDVSSELPPVFADEDRLQQIFYNLIGNSLKFTDKGEVSVEAEWVKDSQQVRISVRDTGIGISKDRQQAIFQAFEQADGSTAREYGGTGLGLSITRQLVELHGGIIGVESEVGQGSVFYFTLPLAGEENLAHYPQKEIKTVVPTLFSSLTPTVEPSPEVSLLANSEDDAIRVLLVDDEPVNHQVIKNYLKMDHIYLRSVMNGEEAIEVIMKEPKFDMILLDIMMPRMSGYEVCQEIRKQYLPSEIPVIMITAKNQISDMIRGLETGANDYITKPFSKDEFLARIKTHLNLHQIHTATGRFVPTEFIRSLGKEGITDVRLGDQIEREVTVFFSDIRGYTRLSEAMTPEENFQFVNDFAGRMGPIIKAHQGFINQYLGDSIMALYLEYPEDALKSSIAMQQAIQLYNLDRKASGRIPIQVGMGMHTGSLIMGIIGDQSRTEAATISDTVNTASRLEGLTKHYGASILLSDDSLAGISNPDAYNLRYLGKVQVKGKQQAIGIYECFDGDPQEMIEQKLATLEWFEQGIAHYFDQRFSQAAVQFEAVVNQHPSDRVAQFFLKRAGQYLASGIPEDWTGVEMMDQK